VKRNTYQLPYPLTNPAYPAMLAHDWGKKGQPDPTGYWASEKYDGVRALWDGETFYSRNGKVFHAPQWFKDTLPKTPLDGELWLERSVAGFQKGVGIVKRLKGGEAWRGITYIVFDIPTSTEPFEKVQEKLKRMNLGPHSHVAPQYRVKSEADMLRKYEEALAGGAEGIMLRAPDSRYVPKRTMALLKVKPTDSAEAVVIGYTAGKGRHLGRMGALRVHLLGDKSKQFKIGGGFEDAERDERLYPLGTIVEVNFNDKTAAGLPRFPRFHRVRSDLMGATPPSKPRREARAKPKAVPKPARKATPRTKPKPAPRAAPPKAAAKRDYFSMGAGQLVALGDAGAKAELKRRGRDPNTGKKRR